MTSEDNNSDNELSFYIEGKCLLNDDNMLGRRRKGGRRKFKHYFRDDNETPPPKDKVPQVTTLFDEAEAKHVKKPVIRAVVSQKKRYQMYEANNLTAWKPKKPSKSERSICQVSRLNFPRMFLNENFSPSESLESLKTEMEEILRGRYLGENVEDGDLEDISQLEQVTANMSTLLPYLSQSYQLLFSRHIADLQETVSLNQDIVQKKGKDKHKIVIEKGCLSSLASPNLESTSSFETDD